MNDKSSQAEVVMQALRNYIKSSSYQNLIRLETCIDRLEAPQPLKNQLLATATVFRSLTHSDPSRLKIVKEMFQMAQTLYHIEPVSNNQRRVKSLLIFTLLLICTLNIFAFPYFEDIKLNIRFAIASILAVVVILCFLFYKFHRALAVSMITAGGSLEIAAKITGGNFEWTVATPGEYTNIALILCGTFIFIFGELKLMFEKHRNSGP